MPGDNHHTSERQRATILVVDPDPVARFALACSLAETDHYQVQTAESAEDALTILDTTLIDLILSEVELPGASGLELLERLHGQSQLEQIPVFFVTAEDSREAKVRAFSLGAHHYLMKPAALAEVIARIDSVLRRRREERRLRARHCNLAGDFSGIAFTDLVHLIQIGHRTGYLSLITPKASGRLIFVEGSVYHASFGNLEGDEAFYAYLFESQERFEFETAEFDLGSVRNTIALATTALLMEGVRRLDTKRREEADAAPEAGQATELEFLGPPPPPAEPVFDLPGIAETGTPGTSRLQDIEMTLGASSGLGELMLLNRDRLRSWTTPSSDSERCHVLLVGDRGTAVRALASLARPLCPAEIESALEFDQRVLTLAFGPHSDPLLDVVLLDQDYPAYVLDDLRLRPAAIVIAPREGSWQTLSVQALVELEGLVQRLSPRALLGVVDDHVPVGLIALQQHCGFDGPSRCIAIPPEDPYIPLRKCLADAVQLATAPEETAAAEAGTEAETA